MYVYIFPVSHCVSPSQTAGHIYIGHKFYSSFMKILIIKKMIKCKVRILISGTIICDSGIHCCSKVWNNFNSQWLDFWSFSMPPRLHERPTFRRGYNRTQLLFEIIETNIGWLYSHDSKLMFSARIHFSLPTTKKPGPTQETVKR